MAAITLLLWIHWASAASAEGRIDDIRNRGHLVCGVLPGVAGFAVRDQDGRYSGFEIDLCRAVAVAILGQPDRVQFAIVRSVDDMDQSGVDVVARRLTWTLRREVEHGVLFGPVVFYDGAGFLVRRSPGTASAAELSGKPICVHSGSEANRALLDWTADRQFDLRESAAPTLEQASSDFFTGRCEALVADVSELGSERSRQPDGLARFSILPERISKEPLALLVRKGDEAFYLVVRWTVLGLIAAEEAGITSESSEDEADEAFRAWSADLGAGLGLEPGWLHGVVRAVGNYGEIYDRHLGPATPIGLERGLNELWTNGGLMYAPPLH